jgi:predicted alpha/beta superfamily hydrolase
MYKIVLFVAFFSVSQLIFSQTVYKTINSSKLGESRELKIQLPRSYEANEDKTYPLILVLDGDYLFEPMAGTADYYSYWDEMPEAIVVGVNMAKSRTSDTAYDNQRYLPEKTGAKFFEFLGMELLPFLDNNYRTSKFTAVAGHDLTANFLDYYLLKPVPIFQAYINFSPDLAPEMANRLVDALGKAENPTWFFLATSTRDIKSLRNSIKDFDARLSGVKNDNFHYKFLEVENATHYSMIGRALPVALEFIFEGYPPISLEEYDAIIASEESPLEYLNRKYEKIQTNYRINKKVRVNDFLAVGKALEDRKNWDELEKLGDLAKDQYPKTTLGTYYQARAYEENGRTKKAMKTYQSAYGQEEVAFITIDFMLQKADLIKEDFGY